MESYYRKILCLHRVISGLFLLEKIQAYYRSRILFRHNLVMIPHISPAKHRIQGLSRAIIRVVQFVLSETELCEDILFYESMNCPSSRLPEMPSF